MSSSVTIRREIRIGRLGTVARLCIGLAVSLGTVALLGLTWWDLAGAFLVMPTLAVASGATTNWLATRYGGDGTLRLPWGLPPSIPEGTVIVIMTLAVATALTFVTPMDGTAIYLFVGLSMVLAAAVGMHGCEVLALPNLVLGRWITSWCPVYSPIDRVERARLGQDREAVVGGASRPRDDVADSPG